MYTYLGNWDHGIMLGIPLFEQESILLDFTGLGIWGIDTEDGKHLSVDEVSIEHKAFIAIFDCQMGMVPHIAWKMTPAHSFIFGWVEHRETETASRKNDVGLGCIWLEAAEKEAGFNAQHAVLWHHSKWSIASVSGGLPRCGCWCVEEPCAYQFQ